MTQPSIELPKTRKSIVVLTPGFPPSESESYFSLPSVQNLVKAITGRNAELDVHVVSFHLPFEKGKYSWHGATVYALGGKNRRFPMRFRTWMQAAWRTWRLIRSCDVIALHSLWLAECTYVASHLARFAGIPHIASILGQDALAANPYLKHLALDRMIITACSAKAAEIFFDSTGRRVDHIVPIGLDEEAIATPDQAAERFIDILGVGSLTQVKNFGLFLEVVSGLRSVFPELRCMIIGDGPERPALEAFIQQNRLQSSVQLTGYLPRQTVLQMMRKGRILLHTAHYEGQGYVFLEALASGMYVVCRDVGYTGNGEHVHRCNSTEEMNDMLKTLLASTLDHREVDVIRVERTASAFEKIYGIA